MDRKPAGDYLKVISSKSTSSGAVLLPKKKKKCRDTIVGFVKK